MRNKKTAVERPAVKYLKYDALLLTNCSCIITNMVVAKIQQTKMLVTCQRFGDWFLFGLVWPYSSIQKNIMKVGSKSLLLTCSSNTFGAYLYHIFLIRRES